MGAVNTLSNTRAFSAKYSMERIKNMSVKRSEIGSVKAIHGACLGSQFLGDRGKRIRSSKLAWVTWDPISKIQNKNVLKICHLIPLTHTFHCEDSLP